MWKKLLIALGIGSAAVGAGCDDFGYEDPTAYLVDDSPAERLEEVTLDASASAPGSSSIESYFFNFGMGAGSYVETPTNAPDGAFDGIASNIYLSPGDYDATVTVRNADGGSDIAAATVEVGYGDNSAGAYSRIDSILTNIGWACTQNQDFQLLNPATGQMTAFNGAKAELSDEVLHVIYDWENLTQEQRETISARNAEAMEPETVIIKRYDSPDTIESILSGI